MSRRKTLDSAMRFRRMHHRACRARRSKTLSSLGLKSLEVRNLLSTIADFVAGADVDMHEGDDHESDRVHRSSTSVPRTAAVRGWNKVVCRHSLRHQQHFEEALPMSSGRRSDGRKFFRRRRPDPPAFVSSGWTESLRARQGHGALAEGEV